MIFVAGSRKFFKEIGIFVSLCEKNGIETKTAGKLLNKTDTLENQKAALLKAFKIIDKSDLVYVFAKNGYIGKTVAMEIAYAFATNKKIVSSEPIEELSARALITEVVSPGTLISVIRGKSI